MKIINTYQTTKYFKNVVNKCEYVMVHHDASSPKRSDVDAVKYLATWKNEVSVQFVIWRNWDIYQLCQENKACRHAWKGSLNGIVNTMNNFAIWIEIVSDWFWYTQAQKDSTRELIKYLMKKYNIPKEKVIRHADYSWARGKWDVWPNFFAEYETRPRYQASLVEYDKEIVNGCLEWNGKLRNYTDDPKLKKLLEQTNDYVRMKYWIEKR